MRVAPDLVLGQVVLVFLQLLLVSLQVFNHEVFPYQFVVVREMIDYLRFVESDP